MRVEVGDPLAGAVELGAADGGGAVEDLALEVGEVHGVEVHQAQVAHPRGGEVHRGWRAEASGADQQHAGCAQAFLARHADFRQGQVPGVAEQFLGSEGHRSSW